MKSKIFPLILDKKDIRLKLRATQSIGESEGSSGDGIGKMDDFKAAINSLHSKV